jgi:hypothetical protein
MGGLGNQLFQIFATIAVGIRDRHKIILPYSEVLTTGSITRYTFWDSFLAPIKIFTNFYNPSITNEVLMSLPTHENFFHSYGLIPTISPNQNIRLFGYFQSYKYFMDQQDQIYKLIHLESQIETVRSEYSHLFVDNISNTEDSNRVDPYTISMHFRLGDYKHIQECHNILPYQYYKHALESILNNVGDISQPIRVLYFCEAEDNEVVLSVINQLKSLEMCCNTVFIKVDDTVVDWKQMLIMSCCRSNIIANSTFSWWGAYFNMNDEKMVCYPSQWFGPVLSHNYMGDMFPPDWKQIQI